MHIKFNAELLSKNPKVDILKNTISNKDYIDNRDIFWDSKVSIAKQNGKDLWNSPVIFFHRVNIIDDQEMIIEFRLGEYKDVLFQRELGRKEVYEKYGKDTLLNHVGIEALVITNDNKFVFGLRNNRTLLDPGALCPVTGTLSINEQKVNNFEDIVTFMGKEISEELNTAFDKNKLTFHSLNFCSKYYAFTFIYGLDVSSEEAKALYNEGEYDGTVVLTREEFVNYTKPEISSIKVYKNFVDEILKNE